VFGIGLPEMMVLAIVGLIVLGPERLPGLARDAARMLRSLREMATGAREQLREELGPEFADLDLTNLNPRRAVQRAVFGDDDFAELRQFDPRRYNPGEMDRKTIFGDDDDDAAAPVSLTKPSTNGGTPRGNGSAPRRPAAGAPGPASRAAEAPGAPADGDRPRPRPRPRPGPGAGPGAGPGTSPGARERYDDAT
jgi:sec-independent protein translocase protein TatB